MPKILSGRGFVISSELVDMLEELGDDLEILYTEQELKAKEERRIRKEKRQEGRGPATNLRIPVESD